MNRKALIEQIKLKKSFLCVGLDTDLEQIPDFLLEYEQPLVEFNRRIIEATEDLCVAYKPNIAFYEAQGLAGWKALQATYRLLPKDCLSIADAKRGDIGNTAERYAKAFFEESVSGLGFDSITVAPYMGEDSVKPFLNFNEKWAIVLALTSNQGSRDFQLSEDANGERLFEKVIRQVNAWGSPENVMYVVGATQSELIGDVRRAAPDHFFLVPGVGAQGGDLRSVCEAGLNGDVGLLINATRSIIYASKGRDFAEKARAEALKLKDEMQLILEERGLL